MDDTHPPVSPSLIEPPRSRGRRGRVAAAVVALVLVAVCVAAGAAYVLAGRAGDTETPEAPISPAPGESTGLERAMAELYPDYTLLGSQEALLDSYRDGESEIDPGATVHAVQAEHSRVPGFRVMVLVGMDPDATQGWDFPETDLIYVDEATGEGWATRNLVREVSASGQSTPEPAQDALMKAFVDDHPAAWVTEVVRIDGDTFRVVYAFEDPAPALLDGVAPDAVPGAAAATYVSDDGGWREE